MRKLLSSLLVLTSALICTLAASAQIDITTWQVDNKHTGANSTETQLTPAIVKGSGNLTTLFTQKLDGIVNAQPLYVTAGTLNGLPGSFKDGAKHNVVYLVTQNATVYAFDADVANPDGNGTTSNANGSSSSPLWSTSLVPSGGQALPATDSGSGDITPLLGVTETPVIDPSTGTLYVVSTVKNPAVNPPYQQLLYALDLKTGQPKFGSPVLIQLEFDGSKPIAPRTGDLDPITPSAPGKIPFSPLHEHLRCAMTLSNGTIYLVYASHSDVTPYYGEVIGFNSQTLAITQKFITTPNSGGGAAGIWQGGAGPIFDTVNGSHYMYLLTGNGSFDQTSGSPYTTGTDWGESALKIGLDSVDSNKNLLVPYADTRFWFTPSNWDALNTGTANVYNPDGTVKTPGLANDRDLGAGGFLALPDQAQGSHTHIMVGGGKAGVLYVLDRDSLGGINANDASAIQELSNPSGSSIFTTPAYFNGYIYYGDGANGVTQRQVIYNSDTTPATYISPTPTISNASAPTKAGGVFISGNGNGGGVVWQLNNSLTAWDATNVTNTIYSVNTTSPAGNGGCATQRWHLPIVDNGKIYYSCFDNNNVGYLVVTGLAPVASGVPAAPSATSAFANNSTEVTISWTNAATNQTGFNVYRSQYPDGGFSKVNSATVASNALTYVDLIASPAQQYYYYVVAINSAGSSRSGPIAPVQTLPAYRPAGIVAYWPMDEAQSASSTSANAALDQSGNGHIARQINSPTLSEADAVGSPCYINTCWFFHGTHAVDRLVATDAPDLEFSAAQSFSLNFWVMPLAVGGGAEYPLISKSADQGNSYGVYINGNGQFVFRGPQGDLVGAGAQANQWTNITVVQDAAAGLRYMYVNGVKQANTTPAQAGDGKGDFWIGQSNSSSNTQGFQGYLDEIKLYNIAITPSTVQDDLSDSILSATSLQTQGSNVFGVSLLPAVTPQTEPRMPTTPGSYTLQIQFGAPVSTTVSATLGLQAGVSGSATGNVGTISFDSTGTVMTVPLTNVANGQALNLHLANVGTSTSAPGVQDVPFNVFEGDVSGDHVVDSNDANAVSKHYNASGTTATATIAIYDVNCDGIVNAADVSLVTSLAKSPFSAKVDTNLAVFKAASASSVSSQNAGNVPANAVDNQLTSSWESARPSSGNATSGVAGVDPSTFTVDLGAAATVDGFSINWGGAAASQYLVQSCVTLASDSVTCSDAGSWKTLVTEANNPGGEIKSYLGLPATVARYFRMYGTARTLAPYAYQINEFQVLGFYGAASTAPASTPPTITSAATATATAGSSFAYQITSNPAATTYGATNLPSGLQVTTAGAISGTPTTAGSYTIPLQATNSTGQTGTATLNLTVNAAAPTITSATSATATAGNSFAYQITSNPAATTYGATNLPNGLQVTTAGAISGSPSTAGSYTITLQATNSTGQTGTATLNLKVNATTPIITSTSSATATAGSSFAYQITSNPAATTYGATNLPNGLQVTTAGAISGTPTTAGSYTITLQATNSTGQTGTATLNLTVSAAAQPPATPPATPVLTATSQTGSVLLSWNSVTGATSYQLYRSLNSGGETSTQPIASQTATTYTDPSGTVGTTYYYQVVAIGNGANSSPSIEVSAASTASQPSSIPPSTGSAIYQLAAGDAMAVQPFNADQFFNGGSITPRTSSSITIPAGTANAAPAGVYQANRYGAVNYAFPPLTPNATYTLRLHFAETYFSSANQRVFTVSVNNKAILTDFDIFLAAQAGDNSAPGKNVAVVRSFTITADGSGHVVLGFTSGANGKNNPQVNGIELLTNNSSLPVPAAPVNVAAMPGNGQVNLSWAPGAGPNGTYYVYRGNASNGESATALVSNQTGTYFADQTVTNGVTYYYKVVAANASGNSANPMEVSATPVVTFPGTVVYQMDAGSTTAVGNYIADPLGSNGSNATGNSITASHVSSPAPSGVYGTAHAATTFTYSIKNLTPTQTYTVRLHFVETYFPGPGMRLFNVALNGIPVLNNFDIFAAATAKNTVVVEQFTATTDKNGVFTLVFSNVVDQPQIAAIEVYQ